MQHFPATSVPPVRTTSAAPYGISTPSGPGGSHAPPQLLRFPGGTSAQPRSSAQGLPLQPGVQIVPSVPTQPQHSQVNTKSHPQMAHLPKFKPPSFEGVLPMPESPGSTPREKEVLVEDPGPQRRAPSQQEGAPRNLNEAGNPLKPHGTSTQQAPMHTLASVNPPAPVQTAADVNVQSDAQDAGTGSASRQTTPQAALRFPVGSFVEYRSRSSGLWIIAMVEGYEDRTGYYRLDVQPHAHPDRIRARGSASQLQPVQGSQSAQRDDREDTRPGGPSAGPSRTGSGVRAPATDAQPNLRAPALGQEAGLRQDPANHSSKASKEAAGQVRSFDIAAPLPQAVGDSPSPRGGPDSPEFVPLESRQQPSRNEEEADGDAARREIEVLRRQVSRLQSENDQLKDRLNQEAALKDRYFSELCICHEQLQRQRNATPRP